MDPDIEKVEPVETPHGRRSRGVTIIAKLASYIPPLLALAAIGGVAYWGHRTGWSAPKFSQLSGTTEVAKEDWCVEHNVPNSKCIKCHPELVGASMDDWCPEHGVPESKCTVCHPEILTTGVAGDWCPEHGVPESNCTICHPELAVKGTAPASATGATVVQVSNPSDSSPTTAPAATNDSTSIADGSTSLGTTSGEMADGIKDPKTCQTHNLRVQFASPASVAKAGVTLAQVVQRPMSTTLSANAEVQYNRNRFAQVSSPVPGKVWRVQKEIGQPVKQGEIIALIDAAEVGKAKAELLQALAEFDLKSKTLTRLQASSDSGLRTQAELQEADAEVQAANIRVFNARQTLVNLGLAINTSEGTDAPTRQNIQFMGLPKDVAASLDPKTTTANLLPISAPFDGTIIEGNVVAGEVVEVSKPLFVVTDTAHLWITADLPLADARRVALKERLTFRPDGDAEESVTGTVTWISTAVDDQTRTVKVRADVDNPDGRLLAHTFGKASITIRQSPTATAVPTEAIQWEGCCHVVFVRLTDEIFQTRKVKLGAEVNGYTEVLVGVLPGEVVAAGGSHVLKSEILKSAMGAGCTDGD